jgi:hypothetical protein
MRALGVSGLRILSDLSRPEMGTNIVSISRQIFHLLLSSLLAKDTVWLC